MIYPARIQVKIIYKVILNKFKLYVEHTYSK